MSRPDRPDRPITPEKSRIARIQRWLRRKRRSWAVKAEERRIAKKLSAKARARELREMEELTGESASLVRQFPEKLTRLPSVTIRKTETAEEPIEPPPAAVPAGPPLPPVKFSLSGLAKYSRRYREVRRAQINQKKLKQEVRQAEIDKANVNRNIPKSSTFGVGSTQLSASDVRIPYRYRPIYLVRSIAKQLVKQRVPHKLAYISPAVLMFLISVAPVAVQKRDDDSDAIRNYRSKWATAFRTGRWRNAELAGLRVVSSIHAENQDFLAFFDTLVANGELQKAVRQLISKEPQQRELVLAEYRFDMADRFLTRLEGSTELSDLTLKKLNESLAGPLPQDKQVKARKILASASAIRGDLSGALAILQPIQSFDLVSHCDSLWLGWNMNPSIKTEIFMNEVRESMREIVARSEKQETLEAQDIAARARMAGLLAEENDFISWVESEPRIQAVDKPRWINEVQNLALIRILRTEPLDVKLAWKMLKIVLDREPNNSEMIDTAIGLGIGPPDRTSEEAREWVISMMRSESIDPVVLGRLAMAAHASSQWPLAIECYEKLTKIDPENWIAMNNLAGIYYKVPPYQYEKALTLIDKVLSNTPDNPSFLETRGQILARVGRIEEARKILEESLAIFPDEWNLHNTLSQIYDYEGKTTLAAIHREKLAELKKPANAPVESRIVFPDPKAAQVRSETQ